MWSKKICSGKEARLADQRTSERYLIPSLLLMEQAALHCSDKIAELVSFQDQIVIACGPGNNGADGIAIARCLFQKGIVTTLFCPDLEHINESFQKQMIMADSLGLPMTIESHILSQADWIIDCLFGTGLSRDLTEPWVQIIGLINASHARIISIDMPSGVHATTGKIMTDAIQADHLLTLDCFKEGQWIEPGRSKYSQIECIDIGIPTSAHKKWTHWLSIEDLSSLLGTRNDHSHKGTYGKALLIAGSQEMPGAMITASQACAASGIGTLTVMSDSNLKDALLRSCPFAMHKSIQNIDREDLSLYDHITFGNGCGRNQQTQKILTYLLQSSSPLILDADALWALKDQMSLLNREACTILTPHIKEMSLLLHCSIQELLNDPFQKVRQFCQKYPNVYLILKSDFTIIAHQEDLYFFYRPHSGLAKGGSGDILCGILTGLIGQIDTEKACRAAVLLHNECAFQTKKDPAAIVPQDLIQSLSPSFQAWRPRTSNCR